MSVWLLVWGLIHLLVYIHILTIIWLRRKYKLAIYLNVACLYGLARSVLFLHSVHQPHSTSSSVVVVILIVADLLTCKNPKRIKIRGCAGENVHSVSLNIICPGIRILINGFTVSRQEIMSLLAVIFMCCSLRAMQMGNWECLWGVNIPAKKRNDSLQSRNSALGELNW